MTWLLVDVRENVRADLDEIELECDEGEFRLIVIVDGDEEEVIRVYPCRCCGWENTCGDPPGSECHS